MATHTPTPWLMSRNGKHGHTYRLWRNDHAGELSPEGKNDGYACIARSVCGEANAAFIVRAVNAHDALLSIARQLARGMTMPATEIEHLRQLARKAGYLLIAGRTTAEQYAAGHQLLQAVAAVPCDWCHSPLLDESWPRHAQCERERQERL